MTPRKLFGILGAVLGILLLAGNLGAVDSSDAVVRKELQFPTEQLATIETAYRQLFQGRVHSHPAKLNTILLQIGNETVTVEFVAAQRLMRVEGTQK
ncbi:MAG: hypothetical protein LW870_20415, partial [Pirellula sp.]|nr:hypothetical protein [Pirellula sp.]